MAEALDAAKVKALHHRRGHHQSLVTRIGSQITTMQAKDMQFWDCLELTTQLDIISQQVVPFEVIQEGLLMDETRTAAQLTSERNASETFEKAVSKWNTAGTRMIASARLWQQLTDLYHDVTATAAKPVTGYTAKKVERCRVTYETVRRDGGALIRSSEQLTALHDQVDGALDQIEEKIAPPLLDARAGTASTRPAGFDRKRELLKVELTTFRGDILTWPAFWHDFEKHIDKSELDEDDKLAYLKKYVQSPTDVAIISNASTGIGQYAKHISRLQLKYDQPRKVHRLHTGEYLEISAMKDESSDELLKLQAAVTGSVLKLQATGQFDLESFMTSQTETLLTPQARGEWRKYTATRRKVPPIDELLHFLGTLAEQQDDGPIHPVQSTPPTSRPEKASGDRRKGRKEHSGGKQQAIFSVNKEAKCAICSNAHFVNQCPTFVGYPLAQKEEYVKRNSLCINCLSSRHAVEACRSRYTCRICRGKHHSLLHKEGGSGPPPTAPADSSHTGRKEQPVSVMALEKLRPLETSTTRISPSLELQAQSSWGQEIRVMACYDTAADVSVVTSQMANRLGLQRRRSNQTLYQACGDSTAGGSRVELTLSSPFQTDSGIRITALVVPRIGTGRDRDSIVGDWPFLNELQLADPKFRQSRRFDVLLGSNVLTEIAMDDPTRRGKNSSPMANRTKWGWIIQGDVPAAPSENRLQVCNLTATQQLLNTQTALYDCMKSFCQVEEVPEAQLQSIEDEEALHHYRQTHKILQNGRFEVALPWKTTTEELGASREQAVRRFLAVERTLTRRNQLEPFHAVIKEYFDLGHAERVPRKELDKAVSTTYYLPMHTVWKTSSTTTKLRVVFDASADTTTGVSLNDLVLVGPTVYPLLTDILLRFRRHNIVITADIAKMFRGISLSPVDRDYHRFVWREKQADPIMDCRMTRVTFGVASSPFLATQTLQQVADNVEATQPLAAEALRTSFYVDDFISGTTTTAEAEQLQKELQNVLDRHGLQLRKWRSNAPAVLSSIPSDLLETEKEEQPFGNSAFLKTLGVLWNPQQDNFHVSISELDLPTVVTKRALTSDVAKTFDVLGWFSPSTIMMKMVIQEMWEEKTGWDDEVSANLQKTWNNWRSELPELAARPMERPYFRPNHKPVTVELHGFSDASLRAYAAVIYVRATYDDESPTTTLVTAKTRVAPVKGSTIPRLELCGAQLLAGLMTSTRQALGISPCRVYCWLDSTIVLHWLDGRSRELKTYVKNRVRQCLERLPPDRWRHVPGTENPADCASRGVLPGTLATHPLWWHGPPWLQVEPVQTPPQPTEQNPADFETGKKEEKTIALVNVPSEPWLVGRFSSHYRLKRCVAWIVRFAATARKRRERGIYRRLTTEDVKQAETLLCRQSQQRSFPEPWRQDKRIRSLNPTTDKDGLIRVNGRLGNSELDYAQRFPIILRGNEPLTRLIIHQHHLVTGHAGPTLLMSSLGRQYFLIQGMSVVKAVCRNCTTCIKARAKTEQQLMGQLPTSRVTPGSPFQSVGTDFAGPIITKRGYTRKPSLEKSYVCVFVCLATKAVHLEAVSSLNTADFMACLTRFVSRRGLPRHLHSDNGGNFVGASRELEEAYSFMRRKEVQEAVDRYCTNNSITWHFSPARAPHFGGIWEAVVKSFKFHLKRVTSQNTLNLEELFTVLAKIEAALNSRPLVPVQVHSEEGLDILTPGHFLIGRPLMALPDTDCKEPRLSLSKRWRLCQQIHQQFWKSWSSDYLKQLQARTKWQTERRNVRVGDIVVVREDQIFSTNQWPLARVSQVHTGKDGLVRAVELWTGSKTCCRPITKLTVLVQARPESGTTDIPLSPGGMSEADRPDQEEGGAA